MEEILQPMTDGDVILFIENLELAYIFDLNKNYLNEIILGK